MLIQIICISRKRPKQKQEQIENDYRPSTHMAKQNEANKKKKKRKLLTAFNAISVQNILIN